MSSACGVLTLLAVAIAEHFLSLVWRNKMIVGEEKW